MAVRAVHPDDYVRPMYVVINLAAATEADIVALLDATETTSADTMRRQPNATLPEQAQGGTGRAIVSYRGAAPAILATLDGKGAIVRAPGNALSHTHAQALVEVGNPAWTE